MTVRDDTRKAVDQHWRTAREIHKLIGCWGFTSVRHALSELDESGDIEAKYNKHYSGVITTYREAR